MLLLAVNLYVFKITIFYFAIKEKLQKKEKQLLHLKHCFIWFVACSYAVIKSQ